MPSAYIVGVRVSEGSEASNAGMTHHRYTLGGNYYSVDAVDENGLVPSSGFKFRNPPVACVPMPAHFLANIDSLALIATDLEGATQTVLTSNTRVDGAGLKGVRLCRPRCRSSWQLVWRVRPAALPTPVMEEPIAKLPVTGGFGACPELGGSLTYLRVSDCRCICAVRSDAEARETVGLRSFGSSSGGK